MKTSIVLLAICLPFLAFTQKSEPPLVVQQTMMIKYPDAKKVKWEKEGDSHWEVEFNWAGINYEVLYDNEGNRQETEHQLMESEIPEKFITALKKDYPEFKIDEAWIIETVKGTFYEFELKGKDGKVEVLMNSSGETFEEEEDDDDD